MPKTFHNRLLLLQFILHLLAIVGLWYYWDPAWLLLSILGKYIFANLGLEIGYHRLLAHRSFKTSRTIENILTFLGLYGGFGSSLTWAATHRVHHKYSDKSEDPHPSYQIWSTWFWIDTYKESKINPSAIKDLLRNPFHKWLRDYYFVIWYCLDKL